jgi:hypothetical protein
MKFAAKRDPLLAQLGFFSRQISFKIFDFFFILTFNFNIYNDVFEQKKEFEVQLGIIGILKKI